MQRWRSWHLLPLPRQTKRWRTTNIGMPPSNRTRTDADGRFVAWGLHPGQQDLWVRAPGFAVTRQSVVILEEDPSRASVRLERGARVQGTVRLADGAPVSRARVEALQDSVEPGVGMAYQGPGWARRFAFSRRDGSFEIDQIQAGRLELKVRESRGSANQVVTLADGEEHFWEDCAPGIAEGVKAAIDELTASGARLDRLALPEAGQARELFLRTSLFGVEGLSFFEEAYADRIETIDPNVRARFEAAREVSALAYFTGMRKVEELAAAADERLARVDVLVTPTVPITPPTLDEVASADDYARANGLMTRNSQPINLLALCAITMPVALDQAGMPVGMQLVARAGQEERLLAVALACEKVLGAAAERLGTPPLCAD